MVVTVVTLVNRIERQAGSIVDHLTGAGDRTRTLLDLVETNVYLDLVAEGAG